MKHLFLSLSIIAGLLSSSAAFASTASSVLDSNKKIDTVYVTSETDPANLEVYSLDIAASAIDESVVLMIESFSEEFANGKANTAGIDASVGSAI